MQVYATCTWGAQAEEVETTQGCSITDLSSGADTFKSPGSVILAKANHTTEPKSRTGGGEMGVNSFDEKPYLSCI